VAGARGGHGGGPRAAAVRGASGGDEHGLQRHPGPLVSVLFSGHLGDVHLASATLGVSWATVTGYAFLVRIICTRQ
jgi:hypothetical protein